MTFDRAVLMLFDAFDLIFEAVAVASLLGFAAGASASLVLIDRVLSLLSWLG